MRLSQSSAILFALFSVSLAQETHWPTFMIRHPPKVENRVRVQRFTCKSEDDGSAMVWNEKSYNTNTSVGFNKTYPNFGDCGEVDCIQWQDFKHGWEEVNSKDDPMAPVFDYRWEAFKEYRKDQMAHLYFKKPKTSGTIVFSARGSEDIIVRLSERSSSTNGSCFRIKFAYETQPTISFCDGKRSKDIVTAQLSPKKLESNRIKPLEWRTYMIEWKDNTKIEAFHGNESLVKKEAPGPLNISYVVVEKFTKARLRFHDYMYKRTNIPNARIISYSFSCPENNLNVDMLVSLCRECQLEVQVVTANNISLVNKTFHYEKSSVEYKLPFWQLASFNASWDKEHKNNIILKMFTIINGTDQNRMWAVGSPVRRKSDNGLRQSTEKFTASDPMTELSCQKLSYQASEGSIVYSTEKITRYYVDPVHLCDDTYAVPSVKSIFGEICDFGCNDTCNGTSICDGFGCSCTKGFRGNNCNEGCPSGRYGFHCKSRCECDPHYACDTATGNCNRSKCQDYYLPSGCAKKLEAPIVNCTNGNAVKLSYNMTIFDEAETKDLHFEIKEVGGQWEKLNISIDPRSSSWFWPNESIAVLEMHKDYKVRAVINETHGEEGNFNTKNWQLSKPSYLAVTPMPNGTVTLRWTHYPNVWENVQKYEVKTDFLGSLERRHMLSMTNTTENTTTHSFFTGKYMYEETLHLEKETNYTFSVKAMRNKSDGRPVKVFYVLPDETTLANAKEEPGDPEMKQLIFTIPSQNTTTEENTVYFAMKRLLTCPILKSNETMGNVSQKTDNRSSWIYKLKKGEYPACELHFNVAYVFAVGPDDEKLSFLCWLVILPIALLGSIVLYVLYRKHRLEAAICATQDRDSLKLLALGGQAEEEEKLKSFENYVRKAAENGVLHQQFTALPKGMVQSCEYGKLPENIRKNRNKNLIAYDETRVLLIKDSRDVHSDYINANYIHGYCKDKAYIATQGPLPNTVIDFWRMIWQEEVRIICMLVDLVENGKEMCTRYWPEVGEEENYGDIVVLTTQQRVLADYTYRTFLVSTGRGLEPQKVEHLQYTGWPQEGVPMYSHSVVEYLEKLLSVPPGQGPIVVHCDSGTGRTGAIILCDICRRRLAADGAVDVFDEAKKMFKARGNMLRNLAQYVLAHLVPTQCLLMLPTKVLCADITQKSIDEMKSNIPAHMKRLADTSWMDKALRPIGPLKPTSEENILKNRFKKRTPVGPSLVTLSRYPTYDSNSDYISAVTVDGVKIRKQYIASQLPMPSTLTDFWRLIVEKNVEFMMILQHPDLEDPTCCDIIPRGTTVVPVPGLKVETKMTTNSNPHFTMDKLLISDISREPAGTRSITALTCKNWNPIKNARPPDPEILAEIWRASEKIHRDGPTLVLCYDGVTGCGLYLAMSFMLERMAVEHECDVVLAVRAVRRSRSDYVRAQWQFEYLYEAALKYTESFQDYSNWIGVFGLGQRCQ